MTTEEFNALLKSSEEFNALLNHEQINEIYRLLRAQFDVLTSRNTELNTKVDDIDGSITEVSGALDDIKEAASTDTSKLDDIKKVADTTLGSVNTLSSNVTDIADSFNVWSTDLDADVTDLASSVNSLNKKSASILALVQNIDGSTTELITGMNEIRKLIAGDTPNDDQLSVIELINLLSAECAAMALVIGSQIIGKDENGNPIVDTTSIGDKLRDLETTADIVLKKLKQLSDSFGNALDGYKGNY